MKMMSKKELKSIFDDATAICNVYASYQFPNNVYVENKELNDAFYEHLQLMCKIPMWYYIDAYGKISCNDRKTVKEIHKKKFGPNTYTCITWCKYTNWGFHMSNGLKLMISESTRGTDLLLLSNHNVDWKLINPAIKEIIDYLSNPKKWYKDIS